MMMTISALTLSQELGARLKQARLNQNLTQTEVANHAGISRRAVINAEKGKSQLDVFLAILIALDLISQLEFFLPTQEISPIQLAKLQGKTRQRSSTKKRSSESSAEDPSW